MKPELALQGVVRLADFPDSRIGASLKPPVPAGA